MGLQNKLVYWRLERIEKDRKRSKTFMNLANAKRAGIVWKESDQAAFEMLTGYLKQNGITIKSLCLSKSEGETHFSKKDFSYLGVPKSPIVKEFIDEKFDLFIDISLSDTIPVQIIRALSLASFKAGWSLAQPNYFDFNLDVSKRREAYYLAEQLIHYLNAIK